MEEQALAIFKIKILNDASHHMKRITAEEVSVKYGVSVKAIKTFGIDDLGRMKQVS